MTLELLSEQYKASGQACKQRARALEAALEDPDITETERMLLRRRVCILMSMARDALETAGYLKHYYDEEVSP